MGIKIECVKIVQVESIKIKVHEVYWCAKKQPLSAEFLTKQKER